MMIMSIISFSQVSGTYSIPGTPYPTIASAIAAINSSGVGAGGVTFNIAAGFTETFASNTAGYINTNTGSASNPVIFQKSGAGTNPRITAGTGTGTINITNNCQTGSFTSDSTIGPCTATPNGGSVFAGWTGTLGCTGTGTCTASLTANSTMNAVFNLAPTSAPAMMQGIGRLQGTSVIQ